AQMRERQIEKIYEAWVEGSLKQDQGELRHHLLHGSFRAEISPEGKEAILEYEVLKKEKNHSELRIRLHTGRYHQIRAQMAAVGCPILGDTKYGSRIIWEKGIALYSRELSFKHPVTHEPMRIRSRVY
ncbi:MAG: RluA family pseudouridine synthase, partial [Rhabdochlamydiaceae bacterium]